jgi:uncharacterized protein
MQRMRAIVLALFALLAAAVVAVAFNFPPLTGPVVDAAKILKPDALLAIDRKLRDYQARSGHQLVVATVPSLEGYDIRDYGNRLFRHWAIGDKQRDDGVLILIAPNEHKVSIEVGYGAEPELTDAISRIIVENGMVPHFKAGDYGGGINAGIDDIARALGGETTAIIERVRNQSAPSADNLIPFIFLAVIIFLIIINVSRGGRLSNSRRGSYRDLWTGGGGSGGRWSGGGWSGGLGGGYSGGGGSSGGGGASGSW